MQLRSPNNADCDEMLSFRECLERESSDDSGAKSSDDSGEIGESELGRTSSAGFGSACLRPVPEVTDPSRSVSDVDVVSSGRAGAGGSG